MIAALCDEPAPWRLRVVASTNDVGDNRASDIRDVYKLLGYIADDLRKQQARITEVRAMLANMNIPSGKDAKCGKCGIVFGGSYGLAEHMYLTHDGPLPEHWEAAEKKAAA